MKARSRLLFKESIPYDEGRALVRPVSETEYGIGRYDRYSLSYLDIWSARKYLQPRLNRHTMVKASGYVLFSVDDLKRFDPSESLVSYYGQLDNNDGSIRIASLWYHKTGHKAASFTLFPDFRSAAGWATYVLARLHQDTIQVEVRKSNDEDCINQDLFLHFASDFLAPTRMLVLASNPSKIVRLNK